MSQSNESLKTVVTALIANLLISIIKLIGYYVSFSPSMLAESLHSLADCFNQALLFLGIRYTSIVPTKAHPWGTGSRQYLFNLFSALGVFFIGCVITIYHAIQELMHSTHSINERALTISIVILLISFLVEGYSFLQALKITLKKVRHSEKGFIEYIKTSDDSSLIAILLEDGVAIIGVAIALVGVCMSRYFDSNIPDSIAALMIGSLLGGISIFLFKNNVAFLMGKSTDKDRELEIREFLTQMKSIDHVIDLKTEVLGPNRIHLVAEIDMDNSSLIDRRLIKKEAKEIQDDPSMLYENLVDMWMRGGRSIARELNEIDKKIKSKFPEIEIAHFEVNGGEHIENFELLKVENKKGEIELNHIGMVKFKGKITKEKVRKSLIDLNLLDEDTENTITIDLTYSLIKVFSGEHQIFEFRD
jgi:zinc transporter 9